MFSLLIRFTLSRCEEVYILYIVRQRNVKREELSVCTHIFSFSTFSFNLLFSGLHAPHRSWAKRNEKKANFVFSQSVDSKRSRRFSVQASSAPAFSFSPPYIRHLQFIFARMSGRINIAFH